ncbi:hypothetical protein GCM10022243_48690 [Saccharothrix violaceirubra]|uniref:Uncharacterized protein n=1 Tax=Saccharothrix violaceirubra TaxID=413306 RepID=A0A7W7SZE5_9PSEU|nr:hypothetical protein [Saccharothrix violaceirubra]MBB4963789.1 hypothetical protein [Saccharothrix violaceirubra]
MSDDRFDDLYRVELQSGASLEAFTVVVRDACREFAFLLSYQADQVQVSLATFQFRRYDEEGRQISDPFGRLTAKARAKIVAWALRQSADAVLHAGRMAVKSYALYFKYFKRGMTPEQKRKKTTWEG